MTTPTKPEKEHWIKNNGGRIAIVDNHVTTRLGLAQCLGSECRWNIAWECGSAEEALELAGRERPDIVILEIQLPGKDGLELIKHLVPLHPDLRILVHSLHSEQFYAERCLRAGASGYLPKSDTLEHLHEAMDRISHGDVYLSPELMEQTLRSIAHGGRHGDDDHHLHALTDRELEILILMAEGFSVNQSAAKLHISHRTVQVHRNNIRIKVGLETVAQLHAYAVRFYGNRSFGDGAVSMVRDLQMV